MTYRCLLDSWLQPPSEEEEEEEEEEKEEDKSDLSLNQF